MAKQETSPLASGPAVREVAHQPVPAPAPVPEKVAEKPAAKPAEKPAAGPKELKEYRVMLRHSPLSRVKNLVVKAADPEGAWAAFLVEAKRQLIEGVNGLANKSGPGIWDRFSDWLRSGQFAGVPPQAEICPEADYQKLRADIRARSPASAR